MSQIFNFLSRDIRSDVFWSETTTDMLVSDCLKGGKISRSFNGTKFVFTPQNCDTGELFIASGSLTKTPETAPPMLRRQYEMINLDVRRSGSTLTLQRVNGIVDSSNAAPRVDVYEGSLSFSALGKTDYYKKIEHLTGFPNSVKSTFDLAQFGFALAYTRDSAGMVEASATDMSTVRWQSVRYSLPVVPDDEVKKLNFQLKLYANLLDAPIATKAMSVTEVYSEIEKQTK
ncbi:hypothetical protein [Undibacterium sp. Di24W]|uniref:hypothetical protein n=1 Tax=Undibacterium sp. Di24W TaxID=3413033 RepID=UPI003BF347BE